MRLSCKISLKPIHWLYLYQAGYINHTLLTYAERCLAWPGKFSCRALSSLVNCGFASTRKASHWPDGGNMAKWMNKSLRVINWMNNGECSLNIVCILYIYNHLYLYMFIFVFTRSSFWMIMGNYGKRRLALEFVSSLMNWAMKKKQLDPARRIDKVIWPSYSNQQTGLYIYGYITLYPLFCWGYFIHGILANPVFNWYPKYNHFVTFTTAQGGGSRDDVVFTNVGKKMNDGSIGQEIIY